MRPDHARQDHNVVAWLALALAMLIAACTAATSAELAIPPRVTPKASNVSMQAGPPNCTRWTDDCVNCTRGAGGAPAVCSNVGLACQPKAIRCLDTP
jgi:hypothetical protein